MNITTITTIMNITTITNIMVTTIIITMPSPRNR